MNNSELSTSIFSEFLGQDGIVRVIWKPNAVVTLADAQASVAKISALTQGKICPLLVDMRTIKSIDREARSYYVRPEAKVTNAIALLVSSPASQVIANFFLRINKPVTPTLVSTSETEALKWLKANA